MDIVNTGAMLMTRSEYESFKRWIKECCGYDLDTWIDNQNYNLICSAFEQYYDEIDRKIDEKDAAKMIENKKN